MSRKKAKSKAKGGSAKKTPRRAQGKRHTSQSWPAHESTPKFSLADEARYVSNHRSAAFEAGKSLRHMPIQFISAGHLQGTLKDKERMSADEPSQPESSESSAESIAPSSPSSSTPDNTDAMAHMALRSPSPAVSESSSSADEVLFRGRGQPPAPIATTPKSKPATEAAPTAAPPSATTTPATSTAGQTQVSVQLNLRLHQHVNQEADSDADDVVQTQFEKRRGGKPAWEGTTTEWEHRSKPGIGWLPDARRPDMNAYLRGDVNPRDAAMEDYMQNVDEFGLTDELVTSSGFARREMDLDGGSHNDWESASGSQDGGDPGEESDNWDSDMLQDFEDMSTSSDVVDTVVRILSKRTRKSGLHYLCVYEGSVTDDARWLPSTFLKSPDEKLLVRAFEAEVKEREQQVLASSDSADEDEDDDDDDDDDDEEDDDDESLDDETIARVLQKQEELGLGSDEMLLYAADDYFGGDDLFDGSNAPMSRKAKKRAAQARGNRNPTFPSATAMADALAMDPYNGFDIMDTDRPSLKPKKKGRRGLPPPELDDFVLNEQMQATWAADRAKKRLKKAEREELRQQGLLGRKGKSPNLKVKYQGGITMEDVVEELREFMMGDMQTMSLPPMEAHRRATIHQAAAFFNLTSRSRGDGFDRFTVLSKTSRTRTYTDDEFDMAIRKKGFQKRLSGPLYGKGGNPRPGKTNGFRQSARTRPQVGYKDGETVGANAPELGPENKGHALMTKMGWSKGMGLGALDNKGILAPIPHTVKTNKAGLQ